MPRLSVRAIAPAIISRATSNSLALAETRQIVSIAFPAFGTGVGGFGLEDCARLMIEAIRAHDRTATSLRLVRLVLFGLCVLALFHWAHRFRYTLYEGLQLKHLYRVIGVFCYGGALVGSAVSAYLLLLAL